MINDLKYACRFPTSGVSLAGEISFQPGSTAISGRNGVGKSFVAEMIRYGLFGKKALRGPASDYKTLDMALTFKVGDADFVVTRAKKEELVNGAGETLAVGADAVNKKIVEILGFDLEVFDVVCAANQKESERLTRLTPARRKELIDDVVGLTRQEAVEKACREEAKIARVEAEALTRMLVLPVEPEKPKGYRPVADLQKLIVETQELVEKRAELQRVIDAVPPKPIKPRESRPDIEALELHEKLRMVQDAHRVAVERQLASMPETTVTFSQLEAAEALAAYDADVDRRGPRPDYKERELVDWGNIWDQKALLNHKGAQCPKCGHEFLLDRPDVDIDAIECLETPPISRKEIDAQLRRHDAWINEPVEPKGERMTAQQIATARAALANAPMRAALQKELDEMEPLADWSAELTAARDLERAWDIYEHEYEHWREAADAATEAELELSQLAKPKHSLEDLRSRHTAAAVYESELFNYGNAVARFDELSAEIAEKQERADAFMAGAKGLVEARRTLKAFLAPSLSRVASKIISEMTVNAERPLTSIDVDEDMNITADGQDVGTFNGAHATMINLALRLALGQVLVARVFPVFIGDELDSDADDANAQAIADALMTCTSQLQQIVLISHKRLEGVDHEVTL